MRAYPHPHPYPHSHPHSYPHPHPHAYTHIRARMRTRDVQVRVREISFSISFSLRGCGGFSFFFISFFVHNSREAMRRGFAPNPGLRWWLCLAPFWPVHNSRAMSPTTTLQCRPGRHCNVAQDDTNRNIIATEIPNRKKDGSESGFDCALLRTFQSVKLLDRHKNASARDLGNGTGIGPEPLAAREVVGNTCLLGQAQECACTGLGAANADGLRIEGFALCHLLMGRVRQVGHFQALNWLGCVEIRQFLVRMWASFCEVFCGRKDGEMV